MSFKIFASISFALIIAAGVVGVVLDPGNYPLPACLNLVAGVILGMAIALEKRAPC